MAEERWQVTVRVPMGLPNWQQEELFDRIAATVSEWEPEQRDGWDADVAAGPAGEEAMLPAVFGYDLAHRDMSPEFERLQTSRQAWAEEAHEWTDIAQHWYDEAQRMLHDYDALTLELARKWGHAKQGKFLAFVEENHPYVPRGWKVDEQPGELRFIEPEPICACVSDDEAAALVEAGFARPQCTVHPETGGAL